jgi:hypothetical protein
LLVVDATSHCYFSIIDKGYYLRKYLKGGLSGIGSPIDEMECQPKLPECRSDQQLLEAVATYADLKNVGIAEAYAPLKNLVTRRLKDIFLNPSKKIWY